MRDLFLLIVVAAMFAGGYFVMVRLDRILDKLRSGENLFEEEVDVEIFQPGEVENHRFQCYNSLCRAHSSDLARRPRRREERIWDRHGRPQASFHKTFGLMADHRGS